MQEKQFSTIIDAKAGEGMLARLIAEQTIIQDRILKPLRQLSANDAVFFQPVNRILNLTHIGIEVDPLTIHNLPILH